MTEQFKSFDEVMSDALKDKFTRKVFVQKFLEKDTAIQMIKLRKSAGLTQKELADRVGMAQGNISRMESGFHSPNLKTIAETASELGFKVELVFTKID